MIYTLIIALAVLAVAMSLGSYTGRCAMPPPVGYWFALACGLGGLTLSLYLVLTKGRAFSGRKRRRTP